MVGSAIVAFTKEQEAAVLAVVRQKLAACPVCHHRKLTLSGELYYFPIMSVRNDVLLMEVSGGMPAICLICQTCGYIIPLHALTLGLNDILGFTDTLLQKAKKPQT